MFKDSNNTKGHGSIRKNKVYGAVGVLALGAAAIVGGTSQASADEVTEAPVNSEPVATSQANADSLMSQATVVATSDVSTATNTTDAINKILNESGLNPSGEFYLWVAKNPVDYYQDYILKNNNVTVNLPATLQVPAGTTVENDFYQIDFGNAYKSNLVSFDTPPAAPVGESGGPTSTPITPVEEVPVQQQAIKVLPNTGEKSTSAIATAGAVLLATALGMLGFSKRSKEY